jgi:hypothetical protein
MSALESGMAAVPQLFVQARGVERADRALHDQGVARVGDASITGPTELELNGSDRKSGCD